MTNWRKIAAARGCAWVVQEKPRFYHSYGFVILAALLWLIVVNVAASALRSVLGPDYERAFFWIVLIAGVAGIAIWVWKQRQILIAANLGPHEGEGAFIVRLPYDFKSSLLEVALKSGDPKEVNWPNYCISCGVAETPYQRGGFEYSNIPAAGPSGKISTTAKFFRGNRSHTVGVAYQVPICDSCVKTYTSANFVQLKVTDGGTFGTAFQFFTFAKPAGVMAPSEYAVRFRQHNLAACYICSYCGEPVGDDVQACKCGKQQPSRRIPLAHAKSS